MVRNPAQLELQATNLGATEEKGVVEMWNERPANGNFSSSSIKGQVLLKADTNPHSSQGI